jgi:cation/acetate symporter
MIVGLGLTIYYMAINSAPVRSLVGLSGSGMWFDIQPISAGVFGVPAGAAIIVVVSLVWPSRTEALAQ